MERWHPSLPLGYVNVALVPAWNLPPAGTPGLWEGEAGAEGSAETEEGHGDQDRKEDSGQRRLGPVLTSQLWSGDLVRASNSRYL